MNYRKLRLACFASLFVLLGCMCCVEAQLAPHSVMLTWLGATTFGGALVFLVLFASTND